MPQNDKGYKYIITAVDFCTRRPVARASKTHEAKDISLFIGAEITKKFGSPTIVMTDCGREFTSKKLKTYLENRHTEHITTTPYHAQANGRVEHLNGVLLEMLKKLSNADVQTWHNHLKTALMVAQSGINRDLNVSSVRDGLWV